MYARMYVCGGGAGGGNTARKGLHASTNKGSADFECEYQWTLRARIFQNCFGTTNSFLAVLNRS